MGKAAKCIPAPHAADLTLLERHRKISTAEAAALNGFSEATLLRNYPHLIKKISKRRNGVTVGDAIDLPPASASAPIPVTQVAETEEELRELLAVVRSPASRNAQRLEALHRLVSADLLQQLLPRAPIAAAPVKPARKAAIARRPAAHPTP